MDRSFRPDQLKITSTSTAKMSNPGDNQDEKKKDGVSNSSGIDNSKDGPAPELRQNARGVQLQHNGHPGPNLIHIPGQPRLRTIKEVIDSGECKITDDPEKEIEILQRVLRENYPDSEKCNKRPGASGGNGQEDAREGEGSPPKQERLGRARKKVRRLVKKIKKREEARRRGYEEDVRHMQQEHADEVAILEQIHAQDWKNLQEEKEFMKLMHSKKEAQ